MEFWQDIGTSPLPYQRIGGASQSWGLAAKFSRGVISNTIAFLGQNPQGGVQVLMLNGYVPQRISTSDIENIITGFTIKSDAVAFVYMVDGHPMYQITFPSANRSFFYDVGMGIWYEAQSGVGDYARHFANLGVVFHSENYVSDVNTGVISQLTTDLHTEGGAPIKRLITSRHLRMGGNEFGVSEIRLEMDTGVGLTSGQGSVPQIMMKVSKDDGKTFGPEKWKSIGKQGQYGKKVVWDRLGSSRDFVFQFSRYGDCTVISPPPLTGSVVGSDKQFETWWKRWISQIYGFTQAIPLSGSATPPSNLDMVFELTDNTHLTIKVRGSDGIVRTNVLVLV
jgi:hypothetical protein